MSIDSGFSFLARLNHLFEFRDSQFRMPRSREAIRVGCRVSGRLGDLVENPDQTRTPSGRRRRRVKSLRTGVVVSSSGLRKWSIRLDHNNTIVEAPTSVLKVIDNVVGLPMVCYSLYSYL